MILSFASCKEKDVSHKTGWQNPDEPTTSTETTTTEAEEETTTSPDTEVSATEKQEINFSEEKAIKIGSFNSEIYGKLTVYHQDGYFLLFDEYEDRKFTVFAEGYSTGKTDGEPQAIFTDMNFDGYTDFGVCYYKDALNSYYFCFLWDNSARTFSYYLPLSNLANPEFNTNKKNIMVYEKLTNIRTVEKTYIYSAGELSLISSKDKTEEVTTNGAETVNAVLNITPNGDSALLELTANKNSHSKWVCIIEDENIAEMSSEYHNTSENTYEFLLSAVSPGATTVIFRYVSVYTGEYIEEIIVNAITNDDLTIDIIVP